MTIPANPLRIAIVDAGGANIGSVTHALTRLGVTAELADTPAKLRAADRLILPGVGAAAPAMARLQQLGLIDTLQSTSIPLLGVCLGMQLLFEFSDEGQTSMLGHVPGRVRQLPESPGLRVPHMGWNALALRSSDSLLDGIADGDQVYFVHSYAAPVGVHCIASCRHGDEFTAIVRRGSVMGMQFHPERSGLVGARLLGNFLNPDFDWS